MISLNRTLDIIEVDLHRNDDCKHYDKCIDLAATKRYESFSCLYCKKYVKSKNHIKYDSTRTAPQGFQYPSPGDGPCGNEFRKKLTAGFYKVKNEVHEHCVKSHCDGQ